MKKLFNWLLIVAGVMIAITFIVRLLNPEFAAEMDKRADSTRAADSVKNAMQAQLRAEQAAEKERQSKSLGVSAKDALAGFSEIEGVKIASGKLGTGEPRIMAEYKSFIVECIGDESNINRATLVIINDGAQQTAKLNAVALSRFVKNVLHSDHLDPFVAALKVEKTSFQVNDRTVTVSTGNIDGMRMTTFTATK